MVISVGTDDDGCLVAEVCEGSGATVGGPAAFVNAVMDALKGSGVRNVDMPLLPDRVYEALTERRDVSGAPPIRTDR